jgi:hypothetical protein
MQERGRQPMPNQMSAFGIEPGKLHSSITGDPFGLHIA